MDQHTYDNWKKIKEVMEEKGTTDNNFYKRAVEIMFTRKDPLDKFMNDGKRT